jgi:hypothetical protein
MVIAISQSMEMRYLVPVLIIMLSGCAYFSVKPQDMSALEKERSMERTRLEAEAGAVPGAYVCKKYAVGIAEIDWVKGTVIEAKRDRIRVKIDDPGNFPHEVNGMEVAKGALVRDNVMGWVPCVKALAVHP